MFLLFHIVSNSMLYLDDPGEEFISLLRSFDQGLEEELIRLVQTHIVAAHEVHAEIPNDWVMHAHIDETLLLVRKVLWLGVAFHKHLEIIFGVRSLRKLLFQVADVRCHVGSSLLQL